MNIKTSYKFLLFALVLVVVLSGCRLNRKQVPPETAIGESPADQAATSQPVNKEGPAFQIGRNGFSIIMDGDSREFIVYVPNGYDANQPTPVVFMFHGSNQVGQLMYDNTNWAGKADAENFIVVFPTSWKYPLVGEIGTHTKWNDPTLYLIAQPGTELKDDVKFVQAMLVQIEATFNVDQKRLFATGFSNGGSFVSSSLLFQMNKTFAAFAICGSGIKLGNENFTDNYPSDIATSLFSILGTEDEKLSEATGHAIPFPFDANGILADEFFGPMLKNTASLLGLDPAQYTHKDTSGYTGFQFSQSTIGANNEYVFLMVNKMGHVYPSLDNNRYGLNAADLFWEFFMRHPLK